MWLIPNDARPVGERECWLAIDGSTIGGEDLGPSEHEQVAIDVLVDPAVLLEAAYEEGLIDDRKFRRTMDNIDIARSSQIAKLWHYGMIDVPPEWGMKATGGDAERYVKIISDARDAMMKYADGIRVVAHNFQLWVLGDKHLRAIQAYLRKDASSSSKRWGSSRVKACIEEMQNWPETKSGCMSIQELLETRDVSDFWKWRMPVLL